MTHEKWLQAQYSVLGSVLIEPDLVPKVIQQTRSTDFSGECATVYKAIVKVFQSGAPVDPVSVAHALGPEYRSLLAQLMEITPTAANIDSYIQICREQAKVLSVRAIAEQLIKASDSDQIRKLLEKASGMMVDKTSLQIENMREGMDSFIRRHTGEVNYLTWPIPELNDRLYVEPGDFIIIGGKPSAGKSAFSLQCARHWAKQMKVGFFSLETSKDKLYDRMMAPALSISMDDLKRNRITDEQWSNLAMQAPQIFEEDLDRIPAAGMTTADIRSVTMMNGYQLIIIDYLQLIISSGFNRTEIVTNISLDLHRMAQDMGVTIVALSQVKRNDSDSSPESSDLRESGQLEQDADVIMLLKLEKKDHPEGNRQLYITKNKEGTCPMITLAFDGKHQTFTKASRTGEVVSKFAADAKRAQRNREAAYKPQQMTMLPENTYVPFEEGNDIEK